MTERLEDRVRAFMQDDPEFPETGAGATRVAAAIARFVAGELARSAGAVAGELPFPEAMTPSIDQALGEMVFVTAPIAHLFRDTGETVPPKAEREQAFVLFWFLRLALEHRENWRKIAGAEIERRLAILKAKKQDPGLAGQAGVEVDHD
ncbi:hypothetical protein [Bradyrhizobium liaoningense]|uniref:hypothetical protein n=1 Tax=Bradyrhizobium liaoningense TaxID=43992 RepID=UPI001BACA830|nr:hypothetical protein [Bradyrhizobium liaoningense]MBR0855513.1 hypothetical protein [Bradyrhizobium liaoningense]